GLDRGHGRGVRARARRRLRGRSAGPGIAARGRRGGGPARRDPRGRRPAIREIVTHGEAETLALAAALAQGFRGGEVLLLSGELGSGKTAFVRGLAGGLGVEPDDVSSPTFVLLTSHPGRPTLH